MSYTVAAYSRMLLSIIWLQQPTRQASVIDGNWFDPNKREFPEADDAEKLLYDSRDFNRCPGETGGSGDAPQCPTASCNIENYEDATQV
jgi:hypothetical protein